MHRISVAHALGRYEVLVGPGLLARLAELVAARLPGRRTVMVSDDRVAELYRGFLASTDHAWHPAPRTCADEPPPGWRAPLTFPAGERSKTRATWERLTDRMLAEGYGRDSAIVALGGGVVGDLAGFVAATYMRGVPYVQVPTTTVAMLDASVGGKVGVDTPAGKNLVGAFHPPALVVADPYTLLSLPDAEYRAGLAEAVKHALVADAAYFEWIEAEAGRIVAREPAALGALVRRSVEIKAAVVSEDEREQGRRATLNAGHTVAHALEQVTDYATSHGEAVAVGLVVECGLGERLGVTEPGTAARVRALLARLGLGTDRPPLAGEAMLAAMTRDKKNRRGEIRLALPRGVGRMHEGDGTWTLPVAPAALRAALRPGDHPG
ncbi:MAG TPA: 3-dehydroquinate synthase [Gemmatimonadales bacterium]|nr:3-dehydroquinate synthase [Gemmatimonadales bacterium]